ncbi:MAG: L-threonylcarbamoyladenylate synthase [Gammaproteobacteria bacterium]|nr:L-threonylcarbamoyladenylate synthase [Gammaproteobacteria bacterium]
MSQYFEIHPTHPQERLTRQAAEIVRDGGIIVYPTDATYALGCGLLNGSGLNRIRTIRQLKANHLLTIVCKDLSELSTYAHVDNATYRMLRRNTPGPFTFILRATRDVPRKIAGSNRGTIGLRIPASPIAMSFLAALDAPLLSTSLILPGQEHAMTDPQQMRDVLEHHVDVIIDGGILGSDPTTLVQVDDAIPTVKRQGIGTLNSYE